MSKAVCVIKKIFSAVTTITLVFLALLTLLTYAIRPFGMTTGIVQSGSMEPAIRTGSLSVIKKADAREVEIGDIIVYNSAGGMQVEHRVTEIDEENQTMTTKGDANEANDAGAVAFDQVIGIHVFSIPYIGYFCAWLRRITVAFSGKSIYNNL